MYGRVDLAQTGWSPQIQKEVAVLQRQSGLDLVMDECWLCEGVKEARIGLEFPFYVTDGGAIYRMGNTEGGRWLQGKTEFIFGHAVLTLLIQDHSSSSQRWPCTGSTSPLGWLENMLPGSWMLNESVVKCLWLVASKMVGDIYCTRILSVLSGRKPI